MKNTGYTVGALLATVVVLVGGTFVGLGWRYVIAGPKGAVGAKEIQQGAVNRVQKQEQFEQLAADYDGYIAKIAVASRAAETATGVDKQLRGTELVGLLDWVYSDQVMNVDVPNLLK